MTDNAIPHDASPAFVAAWLQCKFVVDTWGPDHPEVERLANRAIMLAPPSLVADMYVKARAIGLLPEPDGCTVDGQPCYSAAALAQHAGMTEEEVVTAVADILESCGDLGDVQAVIDPAARVQRKH